VDGVKPPVPMDWQTMYDAQHPAKKPKTDKKLIKWAKDVKARDGYKCVSCGSLDNLHSHHIQHKAKAPNLKYVIENGITLCSDCHADAHSGVLAKGIRGFKLAAVQRKVS
jgi:5-methylcytosine-specific restriction endonuclease McrA